MLKFEFCPANVETFDPRTNYCSGTRIHIYDITLWKIAIVGTWVKHLNVCRTESASMCQSLFETEPIKNKQSEHPGKLANSIPHCDSVIGNHLLHNQKCASHYKDNQFFILFKA